MPGPKEPSPACLLQACWQQQQIPPSALLSLQSSSKGNFTPLTDDPMQHAIAAVPARDLGSDQLAHPQLCCWAFANHAAIRRLGGHPIRRYFWSKEDGAVKKQLPSLPPRASPITPWHPKMQCLPPQSWEAMAIAWSRDSWVGQPRQHPTSYYVPSVQVILTCAPETGKATRDHEK